MVVRVCGSLVPFVLMLYSIVNIIPYYCMVCPFLRSIKCELPWRLSGKESTYQCRRFGFNPWVGKIPRRRKWQPTPVFLPGESHGQRSLAGFSSWSWKRVGHNLVTKQQQSVVWSFFNYSVRVFIPWDLLIAENQRVVGLEELLTEKPDIQNQSL